MNFLETIISTPLGYVMEFCYMIVQSFPLALFIFTILTRLLLFPLNIKQQRSMVKSSAMQGKVKEIQQKYASDKQRQTEELQKLYAEEKMNPLGGCLPLLIQLPIMYGLFFVIYKPLTYILHVPQEIIDRAIAALSNVPANSMYAQIDVVGQYDAIVKQVPELANYGVQNMDMNLFGIINLGETPSFSNPSWLWLIPIASVVFQILQVFVMNFFNKRNGMPVTKSFLMIIVMPLIFFFFAFSVPGGVGFYWACGSLVAILQTCVTSTIYSPGRINARNEFRLAKGRLTKEKQIKDGRVEE